MWRLTSLRCQVLILKKSFQDVIAYFNPNDIKNLLVLVWMLLLALNISYRRGILKKSPLPNYPAIS